MTKILTLRALLAVSAAAGAMTMAGAARAQTAPAPPQGNSQGDASQASSTQPSSTEGSSTQGQGSPDNRDEGAIIVTAEKREQTLAQVPQSLSVVGQATLERQQAYSFTDYAALIPGMTVQQSTPGEARVVLRGINTGSVGSTIAIYVDETPFGSSSSLGNAAVLAGDFDTFDLARIEVLRGPQGTLYGANALGGVLRFVTNAPQLNHTEFRAQAGFESVDGGDTGWLGNAVVNLPLGDEGAIRASGFYHRTPGYIDATGRSGRNINGDDDYGGRVSALFKPVSELTIRLTAIAQNIRANSPSSYDADPVTLKPIATDPFTGASLNGDLTRAEFYPDMNNINYRLYNATIDWDLGFGTLTSVTSYGQLDQLEHLDDTIGLGATATAVYASAVPLGLFLDEKVDQKKFTQEVRLASSKSETVEWLIGGYYTNEKVALEQQFVPFRVSDQQLIPPAIFGQAHFVDLSLDSKYRETAAFANLTWHVTPRFELSAGGRYSHNSQSSVQNESGALPLLEGLPASIVTSGRSSESVFTWSLSSRYEFSPHTSVYARVAKGFRPGGPNVVPPGAGPDFPAQFRADTLLSYEAGLRTETRDRKLAIDTSVYYLDWQHILIFGAFPSAIGTIGANDNGKGAHIYGAETTITLRPVHGLTILFNGSYNNAKLTADTPPITGGLKGDTLPYSPRWAGDLNADYDWSLGGRTRAFIGGDLHLVGRQFADFSPTYLALFGHKEQIPSYTVFNLRAGVTYDQFTLTAFVANVGNSHGLTNVGGLGTRVGTDVSASPIRPRTFGATLAANF